MPLQPPPGMMTEVSLTIIVGLTATLAQSAMAHLAASAVLSPVILAPSVLPVVGLAKVAAAVDLLLPVPILPPPPPPILPPPPPLIL